MLKYSLHQPVYLTPGCRQISKFPAGLRIRRSPSSNKFRHNLVVRRSSQTVRCDATARRLSLHHAGFKCKHKNTMSSRNIVLVLFACIPLVGKQEFTYRQQRIVAYEDGTPPFWKATCDGVFFSVRSLQVWENRRGLDFESCVCAAEPECVTFLV